MAKARLKGKVLGRPSWIEGSLKRSVKVRILKEDGYGHKALKNHKELRGGRNQDISKASIFAID